MTKSEFEDKGESYLKPTSTDQAIEEAKKKYADYRKKRTSSTSAENSNTPKADLPKEYVDFCEQTIEAAYAEATLSRNKPTITGDIRDNFLSDESMLEIFSNIESTLKKDIELQKTYMSLIAKGNEIYDRIRQSEKLAKQISAEILNVDENFKSRIDQQVENTKANKKLKKFDSLEKGQGGLFETLMHKIKKIVYKSYSRARLKAEVDKIKVPLKQDAQSLAPIEADSFAKKVIEERKNRFQHKVEKRSR
jgi:hypothetical protein